MSRRRHSPRWLVLLALLLLPLGRVACAGRDGVAAGSPDRAGRSVLAARPAPRAGLALMPASLGLRGRPGALRHPRAAAAAPASPARRAGRGPAAPPPATVAPDAPPEPLIEPRTDPRRTGAADGSLAEAIVIEVRLGSLAQRTVLAYRVGDEVLLPLTQFFQMAEIDATLSPDGRLEAVLQPDGRRLIVDVAHDTARAGRHAVPVPVALRLFEDHELYLSARALGALLDLEFRVDWPNLQVSVLDSESLPVALRLRREALRAAFRRRTTGGASSKLLPQERKRWDGLVLDYSWLSPGADPLAGASYSAAVGADVFGGALEIGASSIGRAESGRARVDGSWLGVWRDGRIVKQVRVGDGSASGPRGRGIRGVMATNAPFSRPSLLGTMPYAGDLPPGWQLEAYRGGRLIGIDSGVGGGGFTMDLPVLYGENPVDFVAYGPFGETRRFNRTYRVESTLLPAGRLEYGISGGACRAAPCAALANADVRVGFSRRWTAQAGLDRIWRDRGDSLGDLTQPYVGVAGLLSNAWSVEAGVARAGEARAGLRYEPSIDTRVTAEYSNFGSTGTSPFLGFPGARSRWAVSGFVRPIARLSQFFIEGTAERLEGATSVSDRARLSASVRVADMRLLPYARIERNGGGAAGAVTRSFAGVDAFILPPASWGKLFRPVWIRTSLEVQDLTEPTRAAVSVARSVGPGMRVEAGLDWTRGASAPALTLLLASNLPSVRALTTVSAPALGSASVSQLVQGSVLYNSAQRGLELAAGPSLQRAGVAGRVFLDDNGNGRFDEGERGLPNVRMRVGMSNGVSDSSGLYQVWNILPFEPVDVIVDSLSFESPLWVAGTAAVSIAPAPNRYTLYDVPIVIGGVIEGRVVRAGGPGGAMQGVGGATLTLVEGHTGERRTLSTFGDGGFYALGLRPGEYELSVDARTLALLGMAAEPLRFAVPPTEGSLESLELVITPAP